MEKEYYLIDGEHNLEYIVKVTDTDEGGFKYQMNRSESSCWNGGSKGEHVATLTSHSDLTITIDTKIKMKKMDVASMSNLQILFELVDKLENISGIYTLAQNIE
jgi:hypothetical protein